MIAENNTQMQEATQTLYKYNADEVMRERCEAREAYYKREEAFAQASLNLEKQKEELESLAAEKEKITAEKERLVAEKERLAAEKERLAAENQTLAAENAAKDAIIARLLAEKESQNQS